MRTATAGYVLLAVVWVVVLSPIVIGLVRFIRTTRPADLVPRVTVVLKDSPTRHVVSERRARFDPAHWERITPWSHRRRT